MNSYTKKIDSIWLPRVLVILLILFLSLFSLDAFSDPASLSQKSIGFLMHLMPSIILLIALVISWKHPLQGGALFIVLGIAFTLYFHTYRFLSSFIIISFPLFIIGVLFIAYNKKQY